MNKLEDRISHLEKLIEDADEMIQKPPNKLTAKSMCPDGCLQEDPEDMAYCLRYCDRVQPTATWNDVEKYRGQFRKDIERLEHDPNIKNAFAFHMTSPHLIHPNHKHFQHVPEIFSMPLVIHTDLMHPSWEHVLNHTASHDGYAKQLYENWLQLNNTDKDALIDKLSKYDANLRMAKLMKEYDNNNK